MKFNITKDKLTRVLLSANPVLANCKGSKKAVRIFLNMLGFKCVVVMPNSSEPINVTPTSSSFPAELVFTTHSNKLLDIDWFHGGNWYAGDEEWPSQSSWPEDHGDWWPTESRTISDGPGIVYQEQAYDNIDKLVQGNGSFPGKHFLTNETKPYSIRLRTRGPINEFVRFDFGFEWCYRKKDDEDAYEYTIRVYNPSIRLTGQGSDSDYTVIQAINDYETLYKPVFDAAFEDFQTRLCSFENVEIESMKRQQLILGTVINNSTDYVQIYITNVTDADLAPVKSVLAKQLQEILPINMIVKADNIIGYAQ